MPQKQRSWSRLDNAAKIFPSTSEKTDTRVFRFSCQLNEDIDGGILQIAVDKALIDFPGYHCVMKKGLFWYYLEQTDIKPVVCPEYKHPCAALYMGESDRLLFEVTYFRKRINLELYHVLTDGTGAMQFLKTIVYNYITLVHREDFGDTLPEFDVDSSAAEKADDSFRKYYQKQKMPHNETVKKAYRLKGMKNEDDLLGITEVCVSSKSVIDAAHRSGSTMTVFLTALLIDAVHSTMSVADENLPVVIMVPVNLRNFFPSETAKNFFGMISVVYSYKERSGEFGDILEEVSRQFKEKLTKEQLSVRMNRLASLEHNPFVKIAPLPLKNFVLHTARRIGVRGETIVISNVGKVIMPAEFDKYIDRFSVFASTLKLQLCVCSYGDRLTLNFSSAFVSTAVQCAFVRRLTAAGIEAEIQSNLGE